jgi:hypothetical protein
VGSRTVRWPEPVGPGATFDVLLEDDVSDAEVRIYRNSTDLAIGAIVFRRIL